ncbi:hypothetical protein D3C85_384830 [compost metagenome]
MIQLKDIKDFTDVLEFSADYYVYKKDNRARSSLNKTLETNYKAVYRKETSYKSQWKQNDIDFSGETFYVITEKGRILRFGKSEWADIKEV